jgi:hypothetical protein
MSMTSFVAALPGGGWHAVLKDENGDTHSMPIVGWLVRGDGSCQPLVFNAAGDHKDPRELLNFVQLSAPTSR